MSVCINYYYYNYNNYNNNLKHFSTLSHYDWRKKYEKVLVYNVQFEKLLQSFSNFRVFSTKAFLEGIFSYIILMIETIFSRMIALSSRIHVNNLPLQKLCWCWWGEWQKEGERKRVTTFFKKYK